MLLVDDIKRKYDKLAVLFNETTTALNVGELEKKFAELTKQQENPDLYKDQKLAQKILVELRAVEKQLAQVSDIKKRLADCLEFIDLVSLEGDESFLSDVENSLNSLETELEALQLTTLLKGEYDSNNAILSLHAGAGGTEAQDWVEMLYRAYKMYASHNGFSATELDYLVGDMAGIKSVTFMVSGLNAYGYLKAEKGVHRLVRISPFDANAKRHTSFASLEVMPEIENDTTIVLKPDELKIDTYRAGGAGGQHVNKTDSAVRITHLPTGIVVSCQNERSQIQNRETATKMLISKLVEKRERENQEKSASISGTLKKIEWGSQIRSYVFQPYTMVKDHRTGYEVSDVAGVMNGKFEGFIFEYLKRSNA
ncbi:MAG: peptide chain release factor 2 [Firmicutes bacterium]|nr:peptide chain release factor 2 [Bacillota bacterium]